jgi:hypothetical protein
MWKRWGSQHEQEQMPPMTKSESKLLSFVPLIIKLDGFSLAIAVHAVALVCETLLPPTAESRCHPHPRCPFGGLSWPVSCDISSNGIYCSHFTHDQSKTRPFPVLGLPTF